jgi:hypothetical protein
MCFKRKIINHREGERRGNKYGNKNIRVKSLRKNKNTIVFWIISKFSKQWAFEKYIYIADYQYAVVHENLNVGV